MNESIYSSALGKFYFLIFWIIIFFVSRNFPLQTSFHECAAPFLPAPRALLKRSVTFQFGKAVRIPKQGQPPGGILELGPPPHSFFQNQNSDRRRFLPGIFYSALALALKKSAGRSERKKSVKTPGLWARRFQPPRSPQPMTGTSPLRRLPSTCGTPQARFRRESDCPL